MSELVIARDPNRKALLIPLGGTKDNPSLLFPLESVEKGELDQLIRAILAKRGITEEATVQIILNAVEADREVRMHIYEARKELRRLMELKRQGAKLIQNGWRKWVPASFRPVVKAERSL